LEEVETVTEAGVVKRLVGRGRWVSRGLPRKAPARGVGWGAVS
jgi:hypothetical protein